MTEQSTNISDVSSPSSLPTLLTERALGASAIIATQNSSDRQDHSHANPPFFCFLVAFLFIFVQNGVVRELYSVVDTVDQVELNRPLILHPAAISPIAGTSSSSSIGPLHVVGCGSPCGIGTYAVAIGRTVYTARRKDSPAA